MFRIQFLEQITTVHVLISLETCIYILNLISTLHRVKDKTGLYIIIEGSKYDWLEYAGGNTTYKDLFVTPNKKVINPTNKFIP